MGEEESKQGTAAVYAAWKDKGGDKEERLPFYKKILAEHLQRLEATTGKPLSGLPLILSGMVSSNLGMMELPYKALPFALDGSDLATKQIPASNEFPHDMLLISGVRDGEEDVMRGEEVQVVGCGLQAGDEEQIIVHPGTHSKHIVAKGEKIVSFRTFMSGELFALLSKHSILSGSVQVNDGYDNAENARHFEDGVRKGAKDALLHALFSVRTGDLFGKRTRAEAAHYLSGVLIGAELKAFPKAFGGKIILAGEAALVAQYQSAMAVMEIGTAAGQLILKDAVTITLAGQYEIWKRHHFQN